MGGGCAQIAKVLVLRDLAFVERKEDKKQGNNEVSRVIIHQDKGCEGDMLRVWQRASLGAALGDVGACPTFCSLSGLARWSPATPLAVSTSGESTSDLHICQYQRQCLGCMFLTL